MVDRTENQIQVVNPGFLAQYAGAGKDTSLDSLKQYRTVGRLAIVQSMTEPAIKDKHGEGSTIILPDNVKLIDKEDSFLFVPLFFCAEFIHWRDRNDKSNNAIVERTYNAESPLAKRARDPERRQEIYAGGTAQKPWKYNWCEHLNFIGTLYGNGDVTPVAISFSRGEFQTGRSFSSKIFGRKIPGTPDSAPLWAQVWSFGIERHKNKAGDYWWGFSIGNPEQPFIQEVEVPAFLQLHEEFKKAYQNNAMGVDMSGESAVQAEAEVVDNGSM